MADNLHDDAVVACVCTALDAAPLSPAVATRLAQARQRAVAPAARPFSLTHWLSRQFGSHPTAWGAGLAFGLAIAFGGVWQWQQVRALDANVDLQLLADDVPLDMYVSNDFEKWTAATN
ncbi:DUF3619 family protein [Chitinolyticbacter meiyuanensis]|uniref:DUF3619 family protein n=1 Tax=Chitinolyticbacter meiyuanensis TaxID=682798 RepID=UPI0011E5B428|nr:DUF3619 family protein [Chitinolyticbacter meiyuanensis]